MPTVVRMPGVARKPSKYRNVRTEYDGVMYDSKAEAKRAEGLDIAQHVGTIESWSRQPRFELGCPENVYYADFEVHQNSEKYWVEDVKGRETAKFKRDKKLWAKYGPCDLHILKHKRSGRDGNVEVIVGGGK